MLYTPPTNVQQLRIRDSTSQSQLPKWPKPNNLGLICRDNKQLGWNLIIALLLTEHFLISKKIDNEIFERS